MKCRHIVIAFGLGLVLASAVEAAPAENVEPNPLFAENMVLQRGTAVPVWGTAKPGGTVTVRFHGQMKQAVADEEGRWLVRLTPMPAGGPHEMTIAGKKTITLGNALIGEVWLCSGQSNMEFRLRDAKDAQAEIAVANHAALRVFNTHGGPSPEPLDTVQGSWQVCSPKTAPGFTAVGYFFARQLHRHLKVPVGLIDSSVGATAAEAWTDRKTLEGDAEFKPILDRYAEALKRFAEVKPVYDRYAIPFAELFAARVTVEEVDDPVDKGLEEGWAKPACDDSDWRRPEKPAISIPFFGFTQAWAGPSVVWFRYTFQVPDAWAGKALILHGARLTGRDTIFYNGIKVGGSDSVQNHPVQCTIPAEHVTPGRAVIAIRVFSSRSRADRRFSGLKIGPEGGTIVRLGNRGPYKVAWSQGDRPVELLGSCEVPMGPKHRNSPCGLYNAQIHPLQPYAIRGALWYQGESNAGRAYQYRKLLPAMVRGWRCAWGQGEFPFLIVQLANYHPACPEPSASAWAELREAQAMVAAADANAELAVTIDIGDAYDIHPKNKQDVGRRLALCARKIAYGEPVVHAGPTYDSMTIQGDRIRLAFRNTGGGLIAKGGGVLKRFAIAGEDKTFLWADATIDGDVVVVRSDQVKKPVAVRYAWSDNPEGANLYNKAGLPASPFRTDDWPGVTSGKR